MIRKGLLPSRGVCFPKSFSISFSKGWTKPCRRHLRSRRQHRSSHQQWDCATPLVSCIPRPQSRGASASPVTLHPPRARTTLPPQPSRSVMQQPRNYGLPYAANWGFFSSSDIYLLLKIKGFPKFIFPSWAKHSLGSKQCIFISSSRRKNITSFLVFL